jgi:hypothetical protein
MTISFVRAYGLVPRGAAGLACDDDGVTLGPVRSLRPSAMRPAGAATACTRRRRSRRPFASPTDRH